MDTISREIPDVILSALEIDEINHNCPDLTEEEQIIHDKLMEK